MSAFTRSLALVTALFTATLPLGCGEGDVDPELVQELGKTYATDNGTYNYRVDGSGLTIDQPFVLTIQAWAGPDPEPEPDPMLEMVVDVDAPELEGETAAKPTVERASGDTFNVTLTLAKEGIWALPLTVTDANGVSDTCMYYLEIRNG